MQHILIIWSDRDGSRTTHTFDDIPAAEVWLRSVLGDLITAEELAEAGYTQDGVGMLTYYSDEGLDDIGTIDVYLNGMGVTPDALQE